VRRTYFVEVPLGIGPAREALVADPTGWIRELARQADSAVQIGLSNSKLEGLNSKIRLINHRATGTTRRPPSSR